MPGYLAMGNYNIASSSSSSPQSDAKAFNGFMSSFGDAHSEYDKEMLKRTMLAHEAIFRQQICELHRLYKKQIDLMREHARKEFCRHSMPEDTPQTSSISYRIPIDVTKVDEHEKGGFLSPGDRKSLFGSAVEGHVRIPDGVYSGAFHQWPQAGIFVLPKIADAENSVKKTAVDLNSNLALSTGDISSAFKIRDNTTSSLIADRNATSMSNHHYSVTADSALRDFVGSKNELSGVSWSKSFQKASASAYGCHADERKNPNLFITDLLNEGNSGWSKNLHSTPERNNNFLFPFINNLVDRHQPKLELCKSVAASALNILPDFNTLFQPSLSCTAAPVLPLPNSTSAHVAPDTDAQTSQQQPPIEVFDLNCCKDSKTAAVKALKDFDLNECPVEYFDDGCADAKDGKTGEDLALGSSCVKKFPACSVEDQLKPVNPNLDWNNKLGGGTDLGLSTVLQQSVTTEEFNLSAAAKTLIAMSATNREMNSGGSSAFDSLMWFAEVTTAAKSDDVQILGDDDVDDMDSFESIMLTVKESKVDDNELPRRISTTQEEERMAASSLMLSLAKPKRRRRGRRQKPRDFQRDVLPCLASLSCNEANDDLRMIGGLMQVCGEACPSPSKTPVEGVDLSLIRWGRTRQCQRRQPRHASPCNAGAAVSRTAS